MPAQLNEEPAGRGARRHQPGDTNEVLLRGRLSGAPEERVLPSGDTVWTFRVVVGRPRDPTTGRAGRAGRTGGAGGVDTLECAVWAGRVKKSVPAWRDADTVEVAGALRRRFFRAGGATVSRVEVDVARGRVIRRAATG
jgi:single-strand DNA-binding protein